jgi:hypothetical protein
MAKIRVTIESVDDEGNPEEGKGKSVLTTEVEEEADIHDEIISTLSDEFGFIAEE